MEGRKMSVNPRPCSGRTIILARKRLRVDGFVNDVKKLQAREISSTTDRSFSMRNGLERFKNIRLQLELENGYAIDVFREQYGNVKNLPT